MNLECFTNKNLFDATKELFSQFGINLSTNTKQALDIKNILKDKYKDTCPFKDIKKVYYSGKIEDSFGDSGMNDNCQYEDAIKIANKKYGGLMLFSMELNKTPNRSQIAELTRAFNQISQKMPVGLVLKYDNKISIALSERFKYLQDWRQGERVGKVIILRDINTEKPHAGHLRILEDLAKHNAKNFNELHEKWLKVLNIKTLNNNFYKRLVGWYEACFDDIKINLTAASKILDKKIDDELKPQAVIRVIIRLLFIWFMKEKGLIKNDFFKREFAGDFLKNKNTYYNAILQNLFFAVLNKRINERRFRNKDDANYYNPKKNDYGVFEVFRFEDDFKPGKAQAFLKLADTIPFVNGGLFTCHDYTFIGRDSVTNEKNSKFNYLIDGFSERKNCRAKISDNVIFELIDLFNDFVFTIEESTPQEQDIALDPELLGIIFENLISFYNPETKESARNQTGSFYTPREIVDYMCRESLKESLKSKFPDLRSKIDNLIDNDEDSCLTFPQKKSIESAVINLKILDPACGSGAFPMGMFNMMVRIVERLDNCKTTYENKLDIIKHCIYGVDIQNIAVEISKLRFFISLLVDCPMPENIEDFDVLPNLETKFIVANTLIGINLENSSDVFVEFLREEFEKLTGIFLLFTTAETPEEKTQIKNDFNNKKEKILNDSRFEASTDVKEKIRAWNPFNVCYCSPFFDNSIMFGLPDGFDVVIGNPPYVSTKGVTDEDKRLLREEYGFADDMYSHFFFKGCKLLTDNGGLTYISSKTFWTTQTKRNLRDLLLSKTIKYIFDSANPFEAAMVDTCITFIQNKEMTNNKIQFLDGSEDLFNPKHYVVEQNIYLNTQNTVIFKPTPENLKIYELYGEKVKELYNKWWDKISTSKNIDKNKTELEAYRKNLKPGDFTLLGCITEGGVGLQTGNNGRYIAVRKSTKWAKNILASRPEKLAKAMETCKIRIPQMAKFNNTTDFLNHLTETQIAKLFDDLKETYGRDIFGQGYIYRLIDDSEMADVDTLTESEKQNGIPQNKKYYVPYDKGDKDGNRWYLETPFAIAWTQKNVGFLKADPKARYQGYMFYFREGFCWSNVLTTYIKCRRKQKTVHSTESMSLFSVTDCVPEYYMICMINSRFIAYYVDSFVNATSHCTTGDAKLIPIIVPTDKQRRLFKSVFDEALKVRNDESKNLISEKEAEILLKNIQTELDIAVAELYGILYSI